MNSFGNLSMNVALPALGCQETRSYYITGGGGGVSVMYFIFTDDTDVARNVS